MFTTEEKRMIGKYLTGEVGRVKIVFKESIKRKIDELNELERMISPFYAIEQLLEMELGYRVRIIAREKEVKPRYGLPHHEFRGYKIYKLKSKK